MGDIIQWRRNETLQIKGMLPIARFLSKETLKVQTGLQDKKTNKQQNNLTS